MKKGATLSYSHGFNIVEEGMEVREGFDGYYGSTKKPWFRSYGKNTNVVLEFQPLLPYTLITILHGVGLEQAKAYCVATGGHRAGVLESSFVAEVKSDLNG